MKHLIKVSALAATLLSLTIIVSGCGTQAPISKTPMISPTAPSDQNPPAANTAAPAQPAAVQPSAVQPSAPAVAKTITISIQNFAFNPTPVTIKAGDSIEWVNNDQVPHAIKAPTFNSQTLNTGDSYKFQFTAAGTYNYNCAIHPSMAGQIIVQ